MSNLPFKPVTLTFGGEEFEVAPERVWGLIGTIEDVITRSKLVLALHQRDIPETKVATAFAAALNYAGAKGVFPHQISVGAAPGVLYAHAMSLFQILNLAVQPEGFPQGDQAPGESKPAKPAKAAKKKDSAKQPIKSGAAGA